MLKKINSNHHADLTSMTTTRPSLISAIALSGAVLLSGNANAEESKGPANLKAPELNTQTVLVVGDSLSAEYGLKKGEGWVALLNQKLKDKNYAIKIENASISGETTAGGRAKIDALLTRVKPQIVILELGANDAIRGLPTQMTVDNLSYITEKSQRSGAKVLLLGMQIPPNFGGAYAKSFSQTFSTVSTQYNVPLVGFLLKNVADSENAADLFLSDRVHPNAKAQSLILGNVWPQLEPMLVKK